MNRYETYISHVACGIAAVAMTAITVGAFVVVPAKFDTDSGETPMRAALPASQLSVAAPCTSSESNLKPEG